MKQDFLPSGHLSGCYYCSNGGVWKYFKHEGKKVVNQVYRFCPVCHPNLAQPILPNPGQEEISDEEFNRLSQLEGWTVA